MCEALAALQSGFLSRQIRNSQETMWGRQETAVPAVTLTLKEADRALHGLSNRMNGYQRSTVVELWKRLYDSHAIASKRLLVCSRAEAGILKTHQQGLWTELRALLEAIVRGEQRLAAWFEIGDRLAETSWQVHEGKLPLPLGRQQWDYIYSGADRLSERERWLIGPFFPARYNDHLHLACQLIGTYRGLCGLLQNVGDNITATPRWTGNLLIWRANQWRFRNQKNGPVRMLLDALEKAKWPRFIKLNHLDPDQVHEAARYLRRRTRPHIIWHASNDGILSWLAR
jgi:hypothetical protein